MKNHFLLVPFLATATAFAVPTVEVLHWWTSGSESKAIQVVKTEFEKRGGKWIDSPIAGGSGDTARSVLQSRFVAGNPPSTSQIHMGPQIFEWGAEHALADVDEEAKKDKWDAKLPKFVSDRVKVQGKYVAAPINLHRVNFMWVNPAVLAKVGAKVPTTWAEFNATAEKLKAKGITPLAHGGQPWQDVVLFEDVALGIGGVDFYRKALLERDPASLGSPTMTRVFEQMRKLKEFVDKGVAGRDWNLATAMVIRGDAAFQLQGDWAKGEFLAAGKRVGADFICAPSPGGADAFVANNDSFVFFRTTAPEKLEGHKLLAHVLMDAKIQEQFNLIKGSIPVLPGVPTQAFDACAQLSMKDFKKATASNKAVQGFSSGGVANAVQGALTDVITGHFNSTMSSEEATRQMVLAAKNVP